MVAVNVDTPLRVFLKETNGVLYPQCFLTIYRSVEMTRYIGIRHRRKATKEGEARPTTVAIRIGDKVQIHDLETETDELDFLMARFPVEWKKLDDGEEVVWFDAKSAPNGIHPHHCKWRTVKRGEDSTDLELDRLLEGADGTVRYLMKVPSVFEGLRTRDKVGMVLGGSGDRFAAALSRRGESIGSTVWRIPPFVLKALRGEVSKDDDHLLLASLVETKLSSFYLLRLRDREGIRVKEALDIRQQAMKARISCEQQMLQALIGHAFLSEEGHFPEGVIKEEFDRLKANDQIFKALEAEENRRDKELDKAVKAVEIWDKIFGPIQGCGSRLAAGLIAPIGDIRRFLVEPDANRMQELYARSEQLEQDGQFVRDRVYVADRITSDMKHFKVLQIVRSWQERNGHTAEAQMLTEAINCHRERHKLRRAAHNKGKAKLKAFCGVHCINGKFARRRVGQVSNWNPAARQALYLLGEQFNRRPESVWGKKLLEYKAKLRVVHPEVIEEDGKKRFTNGHIHKMTLWRTLTKFVEALYNAWTRIEKEQSGTIHIASTESAAA